jgi:predicted  nucleic acid-binding Zn-ribbon protein
VIDAAQCPNNKEHMGLFGFGNSNKYVDELTVKIDLAQMECDRMIFDCGRIEAQLQITKNQILDLVGRKQYLKSNENVVVDMFEYKHLKKELDLLYNNEGVLAQHMENFEKSIERCKKHIENLEKQREKSQFKVLEFKKRAAR